MLCLMCVVVYAGWCMVCADMWVLYMLVCVCVMCYIVCCGMCGV